MLKKKVYAYVHMYVWKHQSLIKINDLQRVTHTERRQNNIVLCNISYPADIQDHLRLRLKYVDNYSSEFVSMWVNISK